MDNVPIFEAALSDAGSFVPYVGFFIIYIAVMFIHAMTRFNLLALFLGFASIFIALMMFSTNAIFAVMVALLGVLYFVFFARQAIRNMRGK
jgi:hypothetical protein